MLVPFLTRIPVLRALIFTSLLVLVQLLEHTEPLYSALVFCFFMLSVFAFNTARGFSRPSGFYIFFFSVLVVDVGTVYKAFLGQPAQTNLQEPILLMSTYVATMGAMLAAAFISSKVVTTKDGMAGVLNIRNINYGESALGCLIMYFLITNGAAILPNGGGAAFHSLAVINPFLALSILLATIAAVRDSNGLRSTNAVSWAGMLYHFFVGITTFSKQGMFTPIVCWIIGISWARFRLRPIHLIVIILFGIAAQTVLTPIAVFGRGDDTTGALSERVDLVEGYLTHIPQLRRRAHEWAPPPDLDWRMFYYGQGQGIWDRLSMMPNDSVLIAFSDQGHYFGYLAVRYYFENWVPHAINPHKLEGISVGGNTYMHEMGGLAEGDTSTGISFSPAAEAYHIDGWRGVLVLSPVIYLMLFLTTDAMCGDIRRQPWGLALGLVFAHVAPEGLLGGAISMTWLGNVAMIVSMYSCGYITPVLGQLISGRRADRERVFAHTVRQRRISAEAALEPS